MRCQYCGKNLWPLRGLFDEDFCSKDHRQRYHERVRKALEHLPKGQAAPRSTGIAGFQFEKPRVQQPAFTMKRAGEHCPNPAAPAVPGFTHPAVSPAIAASSFSVASVTPATSGLRPAEVAATAIAPNVMSIESLRERLHQNHGAVAASMIDSPARIAPLAGNMALKASHRWKVNPQVFDELNHVYLHEPDPILEAGMPMAHTLVAQLAPVSTVARVSHSAAAGPSGAGRVEFFPMVRSFGGAQPSVSGADETAPEISLSAGDNIWLEDFMSWRIPVALAPTRSSMAMLPAVDRAVALERFRSTQPASAASAAPLAWQFEAKGLERRTLRDAGPAPAPAMVIEFPAARDLAAQPLSDQVASFGASIFHLELPELSHVAGDLDLVTGATADLAPAGSPAVGSSNAGSDMVARSGGWLPIGSGSVLPSSSTELQGSLAEPRVGADLVARTVPSQLRNGARSVNAGLPIRIPGRDVRLKNGPDFFAAEPVIADSAARPVAAKPFAPSAPLAMPKIVDGSPETLLAASSLSALLPEAFTNELAPSAAAETVGALSIEVPTVEPPSAGFSTGELISSNISARDCGDRSAHPFGWIEPQLAVQIPESHYEDYPLALEVSVPEPRTVTVFETATYDQQSKVLSINEAKSRRFAVPSYMKGMAAGLMLASFLWFGSSSIKKDGMTLRPGDLIRLTIQRRAIYEVGDNFHAGLASWDGKNFGKTWAFDKEGFVRPGRLAVYKPSHDMTDYRMEFLTQIERKGVNWVVRAADDQNYYAMKLAVTEPGPRPLVALVRYTVIDGKKEPRGEMPLQVMMHNNRPYRVQVDVKGNRFLTSIEGQLVDSWSDDRLKSGGVGFFTEGSEKARLYWMKVTKNSDFLGKLCSILVPKES